MTQRFRGARVQAAGQLADGRFALQLWQRGSTTLLAFDVFAATPAITVEDAELTIKAEPGFVRRAGAALRGMTVDTIRSRKGDRVVRIDFASRSRFGVADGYALIAELVPKFGNLVLVKDRTIVSALKEFSHAENARRSIAAGDPYELPPLSLEPRLTEADLIRCLEATEGTSPGRACVAALRGLVPLLPQTVAQSILTKGFRELGPENAPKLAASLIEQANRFLGALEAVGTAPLIVYRDEGRLLGAHIAELHQFDALHCESAASVLPLLSESRTETITSQESDRTEKRRRAFDRLLREREERFRRELRDVDRNLERSESRQAIREQGTTIFATLHELRPTEQEAAKADAAELFSKYQKLTASIPHLKARHAELTQGLGGVTELQWELERAGDEDLDDLAEALKSLDVRGKPVVKKPRLKKRKPLAIVTPSGSRILIGRSPVENAELTFHVARPDDLWFHAQKIPGAHVILQRDDKQAPPQDDVRLAAQAAAFFSKGKTSPRVLVDYTQRKHVRKQPAAPPGLVFYTHPKSLYVEPKSPGV